MYVHFEISIEISKNSLYPPTIPQWAKNFEKKMQFIEASYGDGTSGFSNKTWIIQKVRKNMISGLAFFLTKPIPQCNYYIYCGKPCYIYMFNLNIFILMYFFFRYNVAILLITYIIPIIIISISTAHMSIVLWWRQPATSIITIQLERAKRKKQKVFMYKLFI